MKNLLADMSVSVLEDGRVQYKSRHKNGQLMSYDVFRHGKREGYGMTWWASGHLCTRSFFKNGKIEGERTYWAPNGFFRGQDFYRNGELIDENFSLSKRRAFIRIGKCFRKRVIVDSLDFVLIRDLTKIIS